MHTRGYVGMLALHSWRIDRMIAVLALGLAATCVSPGPGRGDEPAADGKPIRVGIIGLDTSHSTAFTKLLNDIADAQHVPGCRVVAATPKGSDSIASSVSRIPEYTAEVKKHGVEIVDGIPALLERVDVVLLETNDGRPHLEQVIPVLAAGKPVFVDKPIAGSLADAVAIQRLAAKRGVPLFSASSLRFAAGTLAVRTGSIGAVTGADTYSPCALEATHPDLFWYGIHGVEALFTALGPGCASVTRTHSADFDLVSGLWGDGRIGTFRGIRRGAAGYGGVAFGEKGTAPVGGFDGYRPLLVEIVRFFQTGQSPVAAAETLEIYAFMEAADESKRQGGKPVTLAAVLEKAEADATRRLAALGAE